ncbi:MAG: DEAD/DEAH box helicase [Deltaproteobacteria bacterium]|nr:DEAD/DEAH box helicase [Deltaproteobacteria bacterium]
MRRELTLSDYVHAIKNHPDFGPAYRHHRYLPPNEARYGRELHLDTRLSKVLQKNGIERLYNHQAEAIQHIRQGENVMISTPTASGKSLIYNLTVLEALLRDEETKALYLFPLKALEQDQLKNLSNLIKKIKGRKVSAGIYDGDTSPYRRKQIRTKVPEILFTNPDMLHLGIMAYHEKWKNLFENLSFVILDEVHTYRGIFGSHMNQIIKRLKRICSIYGAEPRFIMLSATVNNPKAFGESLIQEKIKVVDSSGAPKSGQHFLFLNPETSTNFSAARLFAHCIQSGFRTIAFTQSRKVTELIHVWISQLSPGLRKKVSSYRAGFLPKERREIEKRLAKGDLLGVVSTSALEMGIDIGHLDICLLVGYPGTIINTWQRGGRVGRSGRDSMVILIAKPDALDQYFIRHPDDLFGRSYEAAILDPHNDYVVEAHLPCAADEDPITLADERFWSRNLSRHLEKLEMEGRLTRSAEGQPAWYAVKSRPHRLVNIRSSGQGFTIFEKETGQAIGTVDGMRAYKECHPGAVYLHRGRQYLVDHLDLDKKDIIVRKSDLKYFTRVRTEKETEIIKTVRSKPEAQFIVREGMLKVTEQVIGYEKRALPGQELMGILPLNLPEETFETVGLWIEIEPAINRLVEEKGLHFMGGIHAIEHGAIGIFPLFALCDRNDIGGICYPYHPQVEKSAIFIYDGYPGGVGLAQRGFEIILKLLEKTLDHIKNCECEEGCPSCIHSPKCGSGNKPLDKNAAIMILECLIGHIPFDRFSDGDEEQEPGPALIEKEETGMDQTEPRIVYFDLETQKLAQEVGGWGNTHLMKISVAVIYDSIEKRFLSFTEDRIDDLLAHLKKADLVVGFNVKGFDYGVLSAYTTGDLKELPTFDILEDIHKRLGFRLGLDHLAKETINKGKTADGLQAVEWFRQGEMKKLTDYCSQDVAATRDLFQYGLKESHLIYRTKKDNRRVRLLVDWNLENMIKGPD